MSGHYQPSFCSIGCVFADFGKINPKDIDPKTPYKCELLKKAVEGNRCLVNGVIFDRAYKKHRKREIRFNGW
jgi:hypothetical protein